MSYKNWERIFDVIFAHSLIYLIVFICFKTYFQGSWSESIMNRMKHVRKYDAKKRKLAATPSSILLNEEKCSKVAKKISETTRRDFWMDVPNVSSVSPDVHSDHVSALKKESSLTKPDHGKLRELMKSTYQIRRKYILGSITPIQEIIQEYPPLATCAGVSEKRSYL